MITKILKTMYSGVVLASYMLATNHCAFAAILEPHCLGHTPSEENREHHHDNASKRVPDGHHSHSDADDDHSDNHEKKSGDTCCSDTIGLLTSSINIKDLIKSLNLSPTLAVIPSGFFSSQILTLVLSKTSETTSDPPQKNLDFLLTSAPPIAPPFA